MIVIYINNIAIFVNTGEIISKSIKMSLGVLNCSLHKCKLFGRKLLLRLLLMNFQNCLG